eukprot:6207361-Pleurochrysis_carterae.AAC.1
MGTVLTRQGPLSILGRKTAHSAAVKQAQLAADWSLERDRIRLRPLTDNPLDDEQQGLRAIVDEDHTSSGFFCEHPFHDLEQDPPLFPVGKSPVAHPLDPRLLPLASLPTTLPPPASAPVLTPSLVPTTAPAPRPFVRPGRAPPHSELSPTWLLERPANAARRRRLNRNTCQRVLNLPCSCDACRAPILHVPPAPLPMIEQSEPVSPPASAATRPTSARATSSSASAVDLPPTHHAPASVWPTIAARCRLPSRLATVCHTDRSKPI